MTNRVDELESQVEKLQATVDGLTEELVEANERIRLLEESVEVDLTTGARAVGHEPDTGTAASTEPAADADTGAPEAAASGPLSESPAQTASRSRTSDTRTDDASLVDTGTGAGGAESPPAATKATGSADANETKADGDESGDGAATEDDDIIVA